MTDAALCADCEGLRLHPKPMSFQRMEPAWPVHCPGWKGGPAAQDRWLWPFVLIGLGRSVFLCMEHIFLSFFNGLRNPPGFEYIVEKGSQLISTSASWGGWVLFSDSSFGYARWLELNWRGQTSHWRKPRRERERMGSTALSWENVFNILNIIK